jgi:GNAT superfamily N-acetyltransferase
MIRLEHISDSNRAAVLSIDRSDISEDWVDSISAILELHQYGLDHHCIGHTYAIYAEDACIGIILMGEGFPWACDPPEVKGIPFYRIMGFILDKAWRGKGIGGHVLTMVIDQVYAEFGPRPILLGVQEDNHRAAAFYQRHGFTPTDAWDEDDRFYIRYPQ